MRGVKSCGRLAHFGMLAHFAIDGCNSKNGRVQYAKTKSKTQLVGYLTLRGFNNRHLPKDYNATPKFRLRLPLRILFHFFIFSFSLLSSYHLFIVSSVLISLFMNSSAFAVSRSYPIVSDLQVSRQAPCSTALVNDIPLHFSAQIDTE